MQGCQRILQQISACCPPTTFDTLLCIAGYVVLHPSFYKDTSGGVLPEICEQLFMQDAGEVALQTSHRPPS